jgi:hypothetical protein
MRIGRSSWIEMGSAGAATTACSASRTVGCLHLGEEPEVAVGLVRQRHDRQPLGERQRAERDGDDE